jgi:hypothetical protein
MVGQWRVTAVCVHAREEELGSILWADEGDTASVPRHSLGLQQKGRHNGMGCMRVGTRRQRNPGGDQCGGGCVAREERSRSRGTQTGA